MKLTLVKLGKLALPGIDELTALYAKRLGAWCTIDAVEIRAHAPAQEQERLLKAVAPASVVVLLDERGKKMSSEQYSAKIANWRADGRVKHVALIVGGPFGFSEAVRQRATETLSFSDMTFPSDLAWLLLWEQTYRAFAILHGSDYHHG